MHLRVRASAAFTGSSAWFREVCTHTGSLDEACAPHPSFLSLLACPSHHGGAWEVSSSFVDLGSRDLGCWLGSVQINEA